MKYRTRVQQYADQHTVDGITVPITRTRHVQVPVFPRDWDTAATRGASALVLALTVLSVVWSTWSIGSLLHGGIGYAAAAIFDVAWAVCLLLEWLARFDAAKRTFPRRLGWALLLATMGAIFWHGMDRGSPGMAVVGAAVSLFAKTLWLGVMKHIDRDLSPEDAQWVAAQVSAANAKLAIAGVRRQVARMEDRAAAELLALEAARQAPTTHAAPDTPLGQADRHHGTVRAAVRAALDTMPDASPEDIADHLGRLGIDTDPDTVRAITGHTSDSTDSSSANIDRLPESDDADSPGTISDTVRRAVRLGVRDTDTILDLVRQHHGQHVTRGTVDRLHRRAKGA